LEFKSLLGVLMAQVGVPKLPRHAQGDRQQSEKARRPTPRHAQSTAQPPRVTQDFHRSRVGEAHEVLRTYFVTVQSSGSDDERWERIAAVVGGDEFAEVCEQ